MCNLYEYEMTPELMQTLKDHFSLVGTSYLDILRGRNGPQKIYPNSEAPVIRSLATPAGIERDVSPMRWGFPAPPFYQAKANVTNVGNTASGYWKPYLKPGLRCLVPATAFSEPDPPASRSSSAGSPGPAASFFYFAGIWREWERDRGTKKVPNIGKDLLFSFLTTSPRGVVRPIHVKAMPVLICTKEEASSGSRRRLRRPCSRRSRRRMMPSCCCPTKRRQPRTASGAY